MRPLPSSWVETRLALQAVGEHVMSAVQYASIGKIGLRPHDGGFATQAFGGRLVAVHRGVLVDGAKRLPLDGATLRAAAELVRVAPGAPDVYTASTTLELDQKLVVDVDSAVALGDWYSFANDALEALGADAGDASTRQIWPEHFDLACDFGDADAGRRANYGGSPGDAASPEPYLYVGPWGVDAVRAKQPDFFTESWGAALHYKELLAAPDPMARALSFFRAGRDAVQS